MSLEPSASPSRQSPAFRAIRRAPRQRADLGDPDVTDDRRNSGSVDDARTAKDEVEFE